MRPAIFEGSSRVPGERRADAPLACPHIRLHREGEDRSFEAPASIAAISNRVIGSVRPSENRASLLVPAGTDSPLDTLAS